jgi:hypothetical protein
MSHAEKKTFKQQILDKAASSSALTELSLPLRVLSSSPFIYTLFLVITISVFIVCGHEINVTLQSFLDKTTREYNIRPQTYRKLITCCTVLSALIPFPFIFSSLVMPLRVFLVHRQLSLKQLVIEAPVCYRLSIQSWIVAIRLLFFFALPAVALFFLFSFLELRGVTFYFRLGLLLVGLVAISPLLSRAIPALCIPFISLLGHFEHQHASNLAWEIIKDRRLLVAFLYTAAIGGGLCAFLFLPDGMILGEKNAIRLLPTITSSIICWLCLSAITGICASALISYEQSVATHQANNPVYVNQKPLHIK